MKAEASILSAVLFLLSVAARAADPPGKALGFFLPDPDAASRLEAVIGRLESDSFAEREAASRHLGELPALPAFVRELAVTERRPESRLRLGEILAAFPLETENQRLSAILGEIEAGPMSGLLDPIIRVMRRGIWSPDVGALHRAARATAVAADMPLVRGCLKDPSPVIRQIGAAALGGLPGEESQRRLAELLDDADPEVVVLAAAALAERKDVRCLPAYARLLEAEDFLTRYQSHAALLGLSGRDFGYDAAADPADRQPALGKWRAWAGSRDAVITGSLPRDASVTLFNGKDLQGWEVRSAGKLLEKSRAWEVKDGELHCTGADRADLWSTTRHENFVLNLEYRLEGPASDSGVGLLLTEAGEGDRFGPSYLEVQLLPGKAGDLYQIGAIKVEARGGPINFLSPRTDDVEDPAGKWHQFKLTVRGGAAEIEINGVLVSRTSKGPRDPGRILLRNEGDRVAFRGIVLLPLPPSGP